MWPASFMAESQCGVSSAVMQYRSGGKRQLRPIASRACEECLHAVTIYYIKSCRLTSSDYRLPIQSISSTSLFVELEQPRQRHARREHFGWRIFVEKSRRKS